jgi:adenylyltransferase/sulfurtransferase
VVSAVQSTEVIKILIGSSDVSTGLLSIDIWHARFRRVDIDRRPDCPACARGRYDFLEAAPVASTTSLWGRNAVHFSPERPWRIDLANLADRLSRTGKAVYNGYLITAQVEGVDMTVFPGGRVLFEGTCDEDLARRLAARYVGPPEGTPP